MSPSVRAAAVLLGGAGLTSLIGVFFYSADELTFEGRVIWWTTVGAIDFVLVTAAVLLARYEQIRSLLRGRSGIVGAGAIIFVLVLGILVTAFAQSSSDFQGWIDAWAGLATVALVIATAAYVLVTANLLRTTQGQLRAMEAQLEELRRNRQLQVQPLPHVSQISCQAMVPYFRTDVGDSGYRGPFLAFVGEFTLRNVGNGPAMSLDLFSEFTYRPQLDAEPMSMQGRALRLDFLQSGDATSSVNMHFTHIPATDLLRGILSSEGDWSPRIRVVSLYRNAPGGSFRAIYEFAVHFFSEDKERMKDWSRIANTFDSRYSALIADYKAQKALGRDRSLRSFDALVEAMKEDVGSEWLQCEITRIPEATRIEVLDEHEYAQVVQQLSRSLTPSKWHYREEIPFE